MDLLTGKKGKSKGYEGPVDLEIRGKRSHLDYKDMNTQSEYQPLKDPPPGTQQKRKRKVERDMGKALKSQMP